MATVDKRVVIEAPRETVWRYLTDQKLLASWLMDSDFIGESGRAFTFRSEPTGDWDGELHCRVVEFEAPTKLSFTWNANDIQGETLVSIRLEEQGDATILHLVHSNFENARLDQGPIVDRHNAGWDRQLGFLQQRVQDVG